MASKHERHFAARRAHTPPTLTAHLPQHPEREKAGQERHKLDERRLRRHVAAPARHAEADCSAPATSGGRQRGPRSHSAPGTWRRGRRAPCGRQRRPRCGERRGVPSHCGEQAECERRRGDVGLWLRDARRVSLACRGFSGKSGSVVRYTLENSLLRFSQGAARLLAAVSKRSAFRSMTPRVAEQDEKARAFRGRTWRCALSDATCACLEVMASPPRVAVTRACAGEVRTSRTSTPRRLVASWSSHSHFVGRPSTWTAGWSSSRA